ncbi:venom serine protease 34-like [Lutzomyia longipalpis]|uniref:venom serine protease 34-like n=1 Tax=Lutzomyia longipalpis TaxID=7200 RepID=UPI002483B2C9|nr:venom serine protease 34-like [Lutzomyia longipalpis]
MFCEGVKKCSVQKMWILVLFGGLLIPSVLGEDCNYALEVGTTAINISSGVDPKCTWTATAYSDYRLKLTCDVHLPGGINLGLGGCLLNFLSISASGKPDFADGIKYCGNESFTVLSDLNRISIKLTSSLLPNNLLGISFTCSLQAVFEPCSCGRRNRTGMLIDVEVNEYPAVAYIGYTKYEGVPLLICGATLISNWRALTSQSCVVKNPVDELSLVVGDYDISSTTDTPYTAMYDIESTICYTNNCNTLPDVGSGDIALLKTKNEIQMNPGVGVSCLPYKYREVDSLNKLAVILVGWTYDSTEFGNRDVQQQAFSSVFSSAQCKKNYPNATSIDICIYTSQDNTKDCLLNSGSSGFYDDSDSGRLYIIGVLNYAKNEACSKMKPYINTRTGAVLDWIINNTPESSYCNV